MAWPFPKKDEPIVDDKNKVVDDNTKVVDKSPAELIAESLAPITKAIGELSAKVEAYKPVPPAPRKVDNVEIPSVLDDENAAFNARTMPLYQRQLETEAKIARNEVKAEYIELGFGAFWRDNEAKIDEMLANTALAVPDGNGGAKTMRGDPAYIRNVADMFIGRAARGGGVRFNGDNKTFFLEGADGSGSGSGERKDNYDGITAKQRKVFERMGVSMEDAKKTIGKLEFVS